MGRERGASQLYDRQAMIINRHKFKLSVTNLGLSLSRAQQLWGGAWHAHCVNKPHNDQKISEAATRVATRCGRQQQHPKTEAQSKHNKTKWSFCGQWRRVDKGERKEEESGRGTGRGKRRGRGRDSSWCWQQVKQRIKFIKYPHLKAPLAKN